MSGVAGALVCDQTTEAASQKKEKRVRKRSAMVIELLLKMGRRHSWLRRSIAVRKVMHCAALCGAVLFSHDGQAPDDLLTLVLLSQLCVGSGEQKVSLFETRIVLDGCGQMADRLGRATVLLQKDPAHLTLRGAVVLIDGQRLGESLLFAGLVLFCPQ